ncbi:hypothetical protein RFI_22641 [Reticulomyxa filosa]|uniref:Uncharacterized protein n=1 Tax=Reticulomyxa filosa TaxID=46433 RepID=X6MNR3_RETFI|nr:hypothetical protein RFI_22641 [Reticulomyxa filosa]|eukprot:ETO14725.1 hypothetical protein RFI_22641 [Reticulomyxa filosa]
MPKSKKSKKSQADTPTGSKDKSEPQDDFNPIAKSKLAETVVFAQLLKLLSRALDPIFDDRDSWEAVFYPQHYIYLQNMTYFIGLGPIVALFYRFYDLCLIYTLSWLFTVYYWQFPTLNSLKSATETFLLHCNFWFHIYKTSYYLRDPWTSQFYYTTVFVIGNLSV